MGSQYDVNYVPVNAPRYERRTVCAITQDGILWSCIAGETEGVRKVYVNDGTGMRALQGFSNPARPALAPIGNGMGLVFKEQIDENLNRIQYINLSSASQPSIVRETKNLCDTPNLCSFLGKPTVIWTELQDGVFTILYAYLLEDTWSKPLKLSPDGEQSFRPAITAKDHNLYVAWEADAVDGRILYVQDVRSGHACRLSLPNARVSNVSLDTDELGYCHIACISARDVVDSALDISEHRVSIAYTIWDGESDTELREVLPMNEGLLGSHIYRGYFGMRRRVTVRAKHGTALFWEMLYEDGTTQLSHESVGETNSFPHYGYLAASCLSRGVWEAPRTLHASGSLYSVARYDDDRVYAACFDQADLTKPPNLANLTLSYQAGTPIDSPTERFARWDQLQKSEPTTPRVVRQLGEREYKLFWGDTHVHSNLSPDAEGDPDELIYYAKKVARLDFMAMVDNDYYPHAGMTAVDWTYHQHLAEVYTKSGEFAVFPGYEFTFHDPRKAPNFNHRYVIYPRTGIYLGRTDARSRTVDELCAKLENTDAVVVAHHPSFRHVSSAIDRHAEVTSSWRVCIEEKPYIRYKLALGERFAFIGSSDTHRGVPGLGGALTGLYAGTLDPESLFNAYRSRRTIATQGRRVAIDLRVDGLFIGEEGTVSRSPHIELTAEAPVTIEKLELWRDDDCIACTDGSGIDLIDRDACPGVHYYWARVKCVGEESFNELDAPRIPDSRPFVSVGRYPFNFARAHGPYAWSTPIWAEIQ